MKVEGVASTTQSYKPFFVSVIYGAVNMRQLPNKKPSATTNQG